MAWLITCRLNEIWRIQFPLFQQIDANLKDDEAMKALEQYKSTFGADINKKNIKLYVEAYSNRQDISSQVNCLNFLII